jgi:LEA14-like dessication related protein
LETDMMDRRRVLQYAPMLAALAGCAAQTGRDPPRVQLVGLDPLEGESLELRFLCRLRVQNPNDTPIDYSGLSVEIWVRGISIASGVSDATGSVPRFGETLLSLPVTVPALNLARVAMGVARDQGPRRLDYVLKGKLAGPAFGAVRFESRGELALPGMPDSGAGERG